MQIGKSAEQNRLKGLEFQKLALRWDEWWEKNWRKFVKDEGEAEIEPTRHAGKKRRRVVQAGPAAANGDPDGQKCRHGRRKYRTVYLFL